MQWLGIEPEVRAAFTARAPVTELELPPPTEVGEVVHYGPIALRVPVDEIWQGFCVEPPLRSCALNIDGFSIMMDVRWRRELNYEPPSYADLMLGLEPATPSIYASRSVNSGLVHVARLFRDAKDAEVFTANRGETFEVPGAHGLFMQGSIQGARWAVLYPGTDDFQAQISFLYRGESLELDRALSILATARISPERLSRAQLDADAGEINRRWRRDEPTRAGTWLQRGCREGTSPGCQGSVKKRTGQRRRRASR